MSEVVFDIVLHLIHTIPVVVSYVILGTSALSFVADQFKVESDRAKMGMRMFFLGCATTHFVLFVLLITQSVPEWFHVTMFVAGLGQAVGAPLFLKEGLTEWASSRS